MTETSEFNPFAATVALFEKEGVCRIVGAWKIRREDYDVDLDDEGFALLPVNIPIGYCLVGGMRAAFNQHHGTTHGVDHDYAQPSYAETDYWKALTFAARHLPVEDKQELAANLRYAGWVDEATFDEDVNSSAAEGAMIDWNDRVVGNHQNQEKDSRVLDFLRSLVPLWDEARVGT